MTIFQLHGREIQSVFQLIGYKENDISYSTAWVLGKCNAMLKILINEVCGIDAIDFEDLEISLQEHEKGKGITDIEINDGKNVYLIIEAKRGWNLPQEEQLKKYSERKTLESSPAKNKIIVTLTECSRDYADRNLGMKEANGIPIKNLSWKNIYEFAEQAYPISSNSEKKLLRELQLYLRGLMSMQNQTSNEVYVVSLGSGKPDNSQITWIDIVKLHNKYFHPMGGSGWPKEPPNYIAFRYYGKLQSIHHIEDYVIETNMQKIIPEMPATEWGPHFVYTLGPAIIPSKEIKTGNIYPAGRVWCHLDLLLTCDTISEARDLTKQRM